VRPILVAHTWRRLTLGLSGMTGLEEPGDASLALINRCRAALDDFPVGELNTPGDAIRMARECRVVVESCLVLGLRDRAAIFLQRCCRLELDAWQALTQPPPRMARSPYYTPPAADTVGEAPRSFFIVAGPVAGPPMGDAMAQELAGRLRQCLMAHPISMAISQLVRSRPKPPPGPPPRSSRGPPPQAVISAPRHHPEREPPPTPARPPPPAGPPPCSFCHPALGRVNSAVGRCGRGYGMGCGQLICPMHTGLSSSMGLEVPALMCVLCARYDVHGVREVLGVDPQLGGTAPRNVEVLRSSEETLTEVRRLREERLMAKGKGKHTRGEDGPSVVPT
jgi:hypothetical protein